MRARRPCFVMEGIFMQVKAYAKMNLALDITGRRADGYHLLDMVMHTMSLHDTLTLEQAPGLSVTCGRADVPCGESNTAFRAARAFFQEIDREANVSIAIEKHIPSQAGLAGGSADAAAVLHALNRMYGAGMPLDDLCRIGLTVGADVPFCVRGGCARAGGIGELLEPAPPLSACRLVVCKPPMGVDTKAAYRAVDAHSGRSDTSYTPRVLEALAKGNLTGIGQSLGNAFADILRLPEVEEIRARMKSSGALGACMTGSGSAVYGLFESQTSAQACYRTLRGRYPETFLCAPLSSSDIWPE